MVDSILIQIEFDCDNCNYSLDLITTQNVHQYQNFPEHVQHVFQEFPWNPFPLMLSIFPWSNDRITVLVCA